MLLNIGIAIGLDLFIGDPPSWPHPIRLMGWGIKNLEKQLRRLKLNLYVTGIVLLLAMISGVILSVQLLRFISHPIFFNMIHIYLLYTCLAARCLADEAHKVKHVLGLKDLSLARKQISYLVGRDTQTLDEFGITKATIETVSENTIDGVLAPLFYMFIGIPFGLSLEFAMIYKVVNTLDSMVGYVQQPYKEIGWASAKCDDVLNFIPARLGSIVMLIAGILTGKNGLEGIRIFMRDRKNHKSPNSGHPESVIAGLLEIQLGGANTYFGERVVKPTLGDGKNEVEPKMINSAIGIMFLSEILVYIFVIGMSKILSI